MLVILRTQLGTFIGDVKGDSLNISELHDPCLLEFITFPVQGRVGSQGFATMRSVVPWPERVVMFKEIDARAFSIVEDLESDLAKLYRKTCDEAWPHIETH